jgi:3-phosphoshikimate 1-carboxyvinyltransferase
MSTRYLVPHPLGGEIAAMPSKSMGHRLIICAALSGSGRVENVGFSQDILATMGALHALGYHLETREPGQVWAAGREEENSLRRAECGESGSTLRFLIPLTLDGRETLFTGKGRLMQRPMGVYEELCSRHGIRFEQNEQGILVQGQLKSGSYRLPGDVSSQFITGLLLALPRCEGDSSIELTTQLESRGYVELTRQAQTLFGVQSHWEGERRLFIPGGQSYKPSVPSVRVEGDWSHAAFFLLAGLLGSGVCCKGLDLHTRQGDHVIVEILRAMGGQIRETEQGLWAEPSDLQGALIDASQCPDLVPALAAAGCAARGKTRIVGAARLRLKESDRLSAMARELTKLGGKLEQTSDGLIICGEGTLAGGGDCCSHNDHRVAMALAVAGSICARGFRLEGAECVAKSAPDFWQEFASLGGESIPED